MATKIVAPLETSSRAYLAAELARQVHDADRDFYAGLTSWAFFELRRRGLWLLIAREGLTAESKRELAVLEAFHAAA